MDGEHVDAGPGRRRWVVALVLVLLYVPFTWLLLLDRPWSDYRWFWVQRWPVLPGLPGLWVARRIHETDVTELLAMALVTAALLFGAVRFMARGPRRRIVVGAVLLTLYGVAIGIGSYHAFAA